MSTLNFSRLSGPSSGLLLCESLTGDRPVLRHDQQPDTSDGPACTLGTRFSGLPLQLQQIIRMCVARDRNDRSASIQALPTALRAVRGALGGTGANPIVETLSAPIVPRKLRVGRRALFVVGGGVALALAVWMLTLSPAAPANSVDAPEFLKKLAGQFGEVLAKANGHTWAISPGRAEDLAARVRSVGEAERDSSSRRHARGRTEICTTQAGFTENPSTKVPT
jgi:hypothetical protein